MTKRLFISPLAEITTLADDKIALSVVGRRYTVEDRAGLIKRMLAYAENGVELSTLTETFAAEFPDAAVEAAFASLVSARVLVRDDARALGDSTHLQLQHRREMSGNLEGRGEKDYDAAHWHVVLAGKGALANALALAMADINITVERVDDDVQLSDYGDKRCLLLSVSDDENFALARAWNKKAISSAMPYLFVGIDWTTVQCGPLVLPRATACYECYYHRVRATRRFVNEFDVRSDRSNVLYNALPSKLAIQWAVAETLRLVLRYFSGTLDNLHQSPFSEIDTFTGEVGRSMVLRLPRCPACGNASTERPVSSVYQYAQLRRKGSACSI